MARILNEQTDSRLNIISPPTVLSCVGMRVRASTSVRLPVVPFPLSAQPRPILATAPFATPLPPSDPSIVSIIDGEGAVCITSKTAGLLERIVSLRQWRVHVHVEITPASARPRVHFRTRLRLNLPP